MLRRSLLAGACALAFCPVAAALFLPSLPAGAAAANPAAPAPRIVRGESATVSGVAVTTWARVLPHGRVSEVGLTLPLAVVQNPPDELGDGPHESLALAFPQVVQQTTYFNHAQIGWNPHGHGPGGAWMVPHFDFHFEGVPLQTIWDIGFGRPLASGLMGDPVAPAPERLPAGYVYPGQRALVPFMGVHASRPDTYPPPATMLAGFFGGDMIFVEPMITQEFLLRRQSFSLDVPRPAVLGRSTRYPTRFEALYDKKADAYHFVFSAFEDIR